MPALVEITDLHKTYRTGTIAYEALRGVSLSIAAGDYVAIMGHSGSGKSTLLHLAGGLDRPTKGSITLDGHPLAKMNETALARFRRVHVGFVFQSFNLVENLTVQANVELPALLNGHRHRDAARKRATALLEELGIAEHARKYPWEMSGGQQQRVAIARALVNEPALLLVDEPTGNLDSANTQAVLKILAQCNARGQTLLMVTHDPRAAAEAHRVVYIHDGRLVDTLSGGVSQDIAQRLAALE